MLPATPALKRCRACETSSARAAVVGRDPSAARPRTAIAGRRPRPRSPAHADRAARTSDFPYHARCSASRPFSRRQPSRIGSVTCTALSCAEPRRQRHAAQAVIGFELEPRRRSDESLRLPYGPRRRVRARRRVWSNGDPCATARCDPPAHRRRPAGRSRVGERDRRRGIDPNARARSILARSS